MPLNIMINYKVITFIISLAKIYFKRATTYKHECSKVFSPLGNCGIHPSYSAPPPWNGGVLANIVQDPQWSPRCPLSYCSIWVLYHNSAISSIVTIPSRNLSKQGISKFSRGVGSSFHLPESLLPPPFHQNSLNFFLNFSKLGKLSLTEHHCHCALPHPFLMPI